MSRRPRARVLALLAGTLVLGGCVYYNGMYNTNRLTKSARKAERDGRPSEARNLWGQVITRADSLVAHHPRSKYAEQASVLRGLALARLGDCPNAVEPLGRLEQASGLGDDVAEEAALALGRCRLELGDAALADIAFARVINSPDSARRHEARFRHARALRLTGHHEEALALLRDSPDPRGRGDLLLALLGTGRKDEAFALADSLVASKDSTLVWDSVLVTLGGEDPRAASTLVSRLQADPALTPEVRARRLYEDALRLEAVDTAAAAARLREAAGASARSESADMARLRLLRRTLSRIRTLDELPPVADSLAVLARRENGAGAEATALGATLTRLGQLGDSTGPGVERGDLRLFLAAEVARDTLAAPALAAGLFRHLAETWPGSPYAPKALLAAQLLDPADVDSARARLDSLYPDSPYLAVLRGEDPAGYRALEDSLQAFAATQTVVRQPRRPGVPGRVLPEDEPRRRRNPPADEDKPSNTRRRPDL
ncbi:MAG TPA: tetratricopeptide repeat protein [Gemmatimonadales bacterium]|nr:tetratricopeptide repeat protein [Gemmatimonadales bacterium]